MKDPFSGVPPSTPLKNTNTSSQGMEGDGGQNRRILAASDTPPGAHGHGIQLASGIQVEEFWFGV